MQAAHVTDPIAAVKSALCHILVAPYFILFYFFIKTDKWDLSVPGPWPNSEEEVGWAGRPGPVRILA